jgi:hypothetical protein
MTPFQQVLRPSDVGELIDLTVVDDPHTRSMADMQLEGVAALYNILCGNSFAYLADEVGMGKTYQAMALAAVVWNEKPNARVLFISPRHNLQVKWFDDYQRFFASNYRRNQGLGDDRVASVLFGEPVQRPVLFDNLRSWTPTIGMPERIASFIRHTSFTRPVYLTANDLGDMDTLWRQTERKLQGWGLFDVQRPEDLRPENASHLLNLTFAQALNTKLTAESGQGPYFDLVIMDEAQCLRNPDNQTNKVLFEALKGHVHKWLFMSATPAHGGAEDIPTILNHYPDGGQVLDPGLAKDLPALQKELQKFMIRRQRRYRTSPTPSTVGKETYRHHDQESWGVRDSEMSALGTLAMGLVQKGLVDVLQGRSNRYRIGFLSSFESLQSSLKHTLKADIAQSNDDADNDTPGDWHHDQSDGSSESEAPDTGFIQKLSDDFEKCFAMPLPHPKVDSVVGRVAPLAFGTSEIDGGHKFLIFTRRVSTVATLRDRLTARYLASVEARMLRCWQVKLDWSGGSVPIEEADEIDDPEAFDFESGENPFRQAMSKTGWLFRYRNTFRASGRNSLFFEDGWLQRLCEAGGVDPRQAADALPQEIWAESFTHAAHSAGPKRQQHRADRVRYIAVQAVRRHPSVFGLDENTAAPWVGAYEAALHRHLERALPDEDPHVAPELFSTPTLWTTWDARFSEGPLALPGARAADVNDADELSRRQVVRSLLGQTFRLTDTLLDLFYADEKGDFADTFLDWLETKDPSANQLRHECSQWIAHLRLIVDSCLEGAGRFWRELAREESWPQLFNPSPVMGVTGGAKTHRTATRQFRTPSMPRVIVCTDTLKEGVDLHLFCDRVLHYGVAWTSGDLEQRVGRVDRYFSQIERRLSSEGAPPNVELHVGYPHVVASLERGQVERVIERQRRAEKLMDSPIAGTGTEDRDLVIGASFARTERTLEPYGTHTFPDMGRDIVAISADTARGTASHYEAWYEVLLNVFHNRNWRISPDDRKPVRTATLFGNGQHEITWSFDAALERYVFTVSNPPWPDDLAFSGGKRRRMVGRSRRIETFTRLLVPTPEEGLDSEVIRRLLRVLEGVAPQTQTDAKGFWNDALSGLGNGEVVWLSDHKAQVVVPRGTRAHRITLYAYEGGVRIVGVVAAMEHLGSRSAWGGEPTVERVREWALDATNELGLGYLDLHPRDGLVFGIHVLHGTLSPGSRRRLVEEVAWRADVWEAALTGADRW